VVVFAAGSWKITVNNSLGVAAKESCISKKLLKAKN
jgi:hypothetical protein